MPLQHPGRVNHHWRIRSTHVTSEGLVVYEPHCGFMVRSLDTSDVVHAFDVRMVLVEGRIVPYFEAHARFVDWLLGHFAGFDPYLTARLLAGTPLGADLPEHIRAQQPARPRAPERRPTALWCSR